MTPDRLLHLAIRPALELLPERMNSDQAARLMLAIAVQESDTRHRVQMRGPARGYWQFERGGGVAGVARHRATSAEVTRICGLLDVTPAVGELYEAIAWHDVLAACLARLLLWTLPDPLPTTEDGAWTQYIAAWRPGKPHPARWARSWAIACGAVR